jgi:formate/nitrite transporter FocA (FNT family)
MAWNLFWVTLGNTVAGAIFMAGAYWVASHKLVAPAAVMAQPAE